MRFFLFRLSLHALSAFAILFAPLNQALASVDVPSKLQVQQSFYRCERDVKLPVTYIKMGQQAYAILQAEGQQIVLQLRFLKRPKMSNGMPQLIGEEQKTANENQALKTKTIQMYVATNEQQSYRWFLDQQNKARLTFLAADHRAEEKIIYNACRLIKLP